MRLTRLLLARHCCAFSGSRILPKPSEGRARNDNTLFNPSPSWNFILQENPEAGNAEGWGVSTEGDVTATWWEITRLSHQSHIVTCGLHMWGMSVILFPSTDMVTKNMLNKI